VVSRVWESVESVVRVCTRASVSRLRDELVRKVDGIAVCLEGLNHVLNGGELIVHALAIGTAVRARFPRKFARRDERRAPHATWTAGSARGTRGA